MGGHPISRVAIAGALAIALVLSAADAGAVTPSATVGEAPDRAVVEVETPPLPAGVGAPRRGAWHSARLRSNLVLDRVAARHRLDVLSRIPETGQLTVPLRGESLADLRRRLAADPGVLRVRADRPVELRYLPNDFAFNIADPNAPAGDFAQWNLRRAGGPAAWDNSKGIGAEVAVIDTGADVTHPDLRGRVAATLDCDGGCGGTSVTDTVGHGTHVAGLACADSDNGYGIASLGFDCNLFVERFGLCSDAAAAIVAAANRGSDAISMSFGDCDSTIADEVVYAWSVGSVPVAAGANRPVPNANDYPSQAIQPPGSGPNLSLGIGLVVTAAKYDGTRASWAQMNSGVSVAAYGSATNAIGGQQGILSSWPAATTSIDSGSFIPPVPPCGCRTTLNGDNRFAYLVGTSMATPQVAGVVALMRSVRPLLSAPSLIRLIKLTSSHCGTYKNGIGWGIVNAADAVEAALGKDADPPGSSLERAGKSKRKLKIESFDTACHPELPVAGVDVVRIFASRNGKDYRRIAKTSKAKFRFKPKRKGRYRFFSVAVDKAGNEEAAPPTADERLRVRSTPKGSKKKKR